MVEDRRQVGTQGLADATAMNRRELLKAMMAGGVMTAAGLWMPGQKLISIPSGKRFSGHAIEMPVDTATLWIEDIKDTDFVRVYARHFDEKTGEMIEDIREINVKDRPECELMIDVPMHGEDEREVEIQTIRARPGDMYARYVTPGVSGSQYEKQAIIQHSSMIEYNPTFFEDLDG